MGRAAWDELTRRENDTLAAVERRLNNLEIAQEFHLSVRTVESHIASLRRKLGVDSRAKLIEAARSRRGNTVQVPRNSFVGREAHVRAVRTLLEQQRWVTVVGPAGAGKTRLALELAASDDRAPVVVELEHASDDKVVGFVAKAIGMTADRTTDVVTACAVALGAQRYLLVLDNCDRVLDAVAGLADELLGKAGSLAILATSRSPVEGSAEAIHQLPPLTVDERGAVRMFLDRAASAIPGAEFSADDLAHATRICERLDGLPLALELAAARLRHLSLAELEARLDDGFSALDRARPQSRHRTLEAAFDWTWDLLDGEERSVLSRLAALPRNFDLALAETITEPGAGGVVLRLLDRSLLSPATTHTDPRRFRLLDSLRAFVLDRTDPQVAEDVRRAHAAFHATMARGVAQHARTDDSRASAEKAAALCVDVNAAAQWAISHDPAMALTLTTALAIGAEQYAPDVDSLGSIARAARDPGVRAVATTTQLFTLGMALCYWDLELVAELAALALEIADDEPTELAAHHLAGYSGAYQHQSAAALVHLDIAESLAMALDDTWQLASVHQAQGLALRDQDPEKAIAAFGSSMQQYARAGDAMHVNNARYMMAATAADAGILTDQARDWAGQCAEYARESGNHHELAHAMLTMASLSSGPDPDSGLAAATEQFRKVGDLRCLTRATLLLARGRPDAEQVPLLRQAIDIAERANDLTNRITVTERLIHAEWSSGARRAAVVELGALTALIGEDAARSRCPDAMLKELDRWDTTITEGKARGLGRAPRATAD
jgi:predicted ATPase/DNA-binding CsgD family transcriptional regulator